MGFFKQLIGKEAHYGVYHAISKLLIQHACDKENTNDFFELLSLPDECFANIYIHKKYLSLSTILMTFKKELSKDKLEKMLLAFQMELHKHEDYKNLPMESKELSDKAFEAITKVYFQDIEEIAQIDGVISFPKLCDRMSFTFARFCKLEGDPLCFQFGKEIFHHHFSLAQNLINKHINK